MHQLGIRTHAELMQMPASELDRWLYFFSIEPAGPRADNWRMGVVTASVMNAICNLKRSEALKPSDIFPDPLEIIAPKPASPRQLKSLINILRNPE